MKGLYDLDEKIAKIGFSNCCISEITLAELKYGAAKSSKVDENRRLIEGISKLFIVIPIYNALDIYAAEKARLIKTGNTIDDFDILIGATAVANDMVLVTNNEKHFKNLENIVFENWTTS